MLKTMMVRTVFYQLKGEISSVKPANRASHCRSYSL